MSLIKTVARKSKFIVVLEALLLKIQTLFTFILLTSINLYKFILFFRSYCLFAYFINGEHWKLYH